MSADPLRVASPSGTPEAVTPHWLAAMIRNWLTDEEVLIETKALVVQPPGDPTTILVFQAGGDHLMVQVLKAEVVVGG